ncbi:transcriptional regulator Mic [Klebsiella pneumoniae]|nr:transcriptional regulator Mic [Klebsiella pneumoniae]
MSRSAKRWPIIPGVPVYIQHDISAWTMAESLFGASRGARDVIQVVIDHNVGAGVITDGRLLHAGSSSLVEIGHTQVDPYGKRCYCGNHGCLETIASVEKRAGAGADAHGAVDELAAAPASAERGVALSGGAAGRFVSPGHHQRRG